MTYEEAIETMCNRCINFEVCGGTGCAPKKTLERSTESKEPYIFALKAITETPLYQFGVGDLNNALKICVELLKERINEK